MDSNVREGSTPSPGTKINKMVDIIGYIATAGTLLSFTQKDIVKLRIINGSAALMWIFYGYTINSYPVILTNLLIVLIHLFAYIYRKH